MGVVCDTVEKRDRLRKMRIMLNLPNIMDSARIHFHYLHVKIAIEQSF